jgi:hypothetical protein
MTATALTVVNLSADPKLGSSDDLTGIAVDGTSGGNFANDGDTYVILTNTDGYDHDATFAVSTPSNPNTDTSFERADTPVVITVVSGESVIVGPFKKAIYDTVAATGDATAPFSRKVNVKVSDTKLTVSAFSTRRAIWGPLGQEGQ